MSIGVPNVEKPSPAYHGTYGGPGPSACKSTKLQTSFTYFWHSRSQSFTINLDVDNMPTPQPYTANQQNQAGPKPGTYQQAPPPQYYQPQQQPTPYQGQPQAQPQMIYVQPHQPQQNKRKDDGCCSPCALFVSIWCRF